MSTSKQVAEQDSNGRGGAECRVVSGPGLTAGNSSPLMWPTQGYAAKHGYASKVYGLQSESNTIIKIMFGRDNERHRTKDVSAGVVCIVTSVVKGTDRRARFVLTLCA